MVVNVTHQELILIWSYCFHNGYLLVKLSKLGCILLIESIKTITLILVEAETLFNHSIFQAAIAFGLRLVKVKLCLHTSAVLSVDSIYLRLVKTELLGNICLTHSIELVSSVELQTVHISKQLHLISTFLLHYLKGCWSSITCSHTTIGVDIHIIWHTITK